jgi:hypothetical protein
MGRIRLTPEERAELLAPGPLVARTLWIKPLRVRDAAYCRRFG